MRRAAPFFVFGAGVLWGTIGIFVRKLNGRGLTAMDVVAVRSAVTAVLMFVFLAAFRRDLLRIRLRDVWCFVGTGIFSIVFFNYCYFRAMARISLSTASVLLYTAPAIVLALSVVLFQERITTRKVIVLAATVAGCGLSAGIAGGGGSFDLQGILFGIGSGLGYALYSIFSRYAIERGYGSATISFYTFLAAAVGTIPFSNMRLISRVCFDDPGMLGYYVLFGVLSTVLPYLLYTLGLGQMENSRASVIASVEPVAATAVGWMVYREPLNIYQAVGMALVLGAVGASGSGDAKKDN